MTLKNETLAVKQMIDRLHELYLTTDGPVDKKDLGFFEKVKKETAPLFELNNGWVEQAEIFVKNRGTRVHPNQVKSTHENIEMLILHSYYLDIERKRYKELFQSSHYVLDMIIDDLDRAGD